MICVLRDQEECRNSVGTRMCLLYLLKQDAGTLMCLLYLLTVPNLGYDMVSRAMSEQRRNAYVFVMFSQAGCRNPSVFAIFAQHA